MPTRSRVTFDAEIEVGYGPLDGRWWDKLHLEFKNLGRYSREVINKFEKDRYPKYLERLTYYPPSPEGLDEDAMTDAQRGLLWYRYITEGPYIRTGAYRKGWRAKRRSIAADPNKGSIEDWSIYNIAPATYYPQYSIMNQRWPFVGGRYQQIFHEETGWPKTDPIITAAYNELGSEWLVRMEEIAQFRTLREERRKGKKGKKR